VIPIPAANHQPNAPGSTPLTVVSKGVVASYQRAPSSLTPAPRKDADGALIQKLAGLLEAFVKK
jgi:hypothetical protein